MTIESFWYRRVSELGLVLGVLVVSLWLVSTYAWQHILLEPYIVSIPALGAFAITAIASACILIFVRQQKKWLTTDLIILIAVSTLLAIGGTGNITSPYVYVWVLVGLFSAIAGLASFLPIYLAVGVYGLYLYQYEQLGASQWAVFGLAVVLPPLVGLLTWSRRYHSQEHSSQDVSELTQELNKESTKSDIIINAIADGVLLIDAKGVIQLINPAAQRIIGWGSEDAKQLDYHSVLKIIDSKDDILSGDADPVQQCLKTGQSVITDKLGIRTVSGKQLISSIMVSPLEQAGSGAIVVFRDLTAQRAEERDQAEFISTASHEMRTPVAAIEGYIGLALNPQTATIDDKARMYLGKAQESAKHLGRLFQDLLDISKLEDGRLGNNPSTIDITQFVRSMIEDFSGQFSEKGLTPIFTPDQTSNANQKLAPIFYASADPDHLHEVVGNLITNAIKYTNEGTVTLDVTGDSEHVYISIKDTGVGIPTEDIPHLFQKFYRVDNTATREIGGTGLGLYLARRLTETMGGHLNVNSTFGTGSTFTIDLPRIVKDVASVQQGIETTPSVQSETKL